MSKSVPFFTPEMFSNSSRPSKSLSQNLSHKRDFPQQNLEKSLIKKLCDSQCLEDLKTSDKVPRGLADDIDDRLKGLFESVELPRKNIDDGRPDDNEGDIYNGDFKDGLRHGRGTCQFADGSFYVGEWKNGMKEGYGIEIYLNEDLYGGEYHKGKRHGTGRYEFANGDVYVGDWYQDKKQGKGTFISKVEGFYYKGEFYNDSRHGEGECRWEGGLKYFGSWNMDKKEGRGVETLPNGGQYEGEFQEGDWHGNGIYRGGNIVYDGEWNRSKKDGRGVQTYSNGSKYEGEFRNDRPHGQGVLTEQNGTVINERWKNGKQEVSWWRKLPMCPGPIEIQ